MPMMPRWPHDYGVLAHFAARLQLVKSMREEFNQLTDNLK